MGTEAQACVVCGMESTRDDWRNKTTRTVAGKAATFVACDRHSKVEVESAADVVVKINTPAPPAPVTPSAPPPAGNGK